MQGKRLHLGARAARAIGYAIAFTGAALQWHLPVVIGYGLLLCGELAELILAESDTPLDK
jgi:hypothetical protein